MVQKNKQREMKQRGEVVNSQTSSEESLDLWEKFWFLPTEFASLRPIRIGLGILSLLYVFSYLFEAHLWFGNDGLMSTERLGQLVVANEAAAPAFWRWSIWHWLDSRWMVNLFFACTAFCSLAFAIGWGGRMIALLLWLGIVSIANAGWVLAEVGMIPLSLGLVGFIIAGLGKNSNLPVATPDVSEPFQSSLNTLARRLIQFHVIGFMLAISLSSIANENPIGEGLRRQLIAHGFEWLPAQVGLCRLLHGILISIPLVLAPVLMFVRKVRHMALAILWGAFLVFGLLSTDIYFALALACMSLAFIDRGLAPQIDTVPSPIPLPQ